MGDVIESTREQLCIRCTRRFTPKNPKTNDDLLICENCKKQPKDPGDALAISTVQV
jgi:hypothetical protein